MSSNMEEAGKTAKARRALVPERRFPEFRDAGEWEEKLLAQVCEVNPPTKGLPDSFVYIDLESVEAGMLIQEKVTSRDGAPSRAQRLLKSGDVIFQTVRPYQKNNYFFQSNKDFEYVASTGYAQLRAHESNMYLFQYIHTDSFVARVLANCTGSNYPAINSNDLSEITVEMPSFMEQQKIADCLSCIDDLITLETRKIDALKAHKKGLMQQLFPAEGETLPKLRFPEFRDAGEWVEKQIGDLKPFVTSGSRGWAAFYAQQGSLFVRITNLSRESIYLDLTDSKFVNLPPEANEGMRTQLKECDILISITADIGIIGYIDASIPIPAYINQHIALVRFNASQVCSKYVSYFLASERSQRLFCVSTDTGTKAGMSLITVQKIKIVLPIFPEQQKIADCLSSIDDLIALEAQKLEALKAHKKGLMQQLFPVSDEAGK